MNILGIILALNLLHDTKHAQVGVWSHWEDTLVITSEGRYYTNCDAVRWMCGESGVCNFNALIGQCTSGGARLDYRQRLVDTLYVITGTGWIPFTPVPLKDNTPKGWDRKPAASTTKATSTTKPADQSRSTQPRRFW